MKKKSIFLILIIILLIIGINIFRFVNPEFRRNFDIHFNTVKEHKSYYIKHGTKTTVFNLPLPPKTAFPSKHSHSAVIYYTKLSYEEFMDYYKTNGFIVSGDVVVYNDAKFKISDITSENKKYKYYFVDIDLLEPK